MIILISGKQGSGKTTLAKAICEALQAHHAKFAGPLYDIHDAIGKVCKLYEIPFDKKEGKLLQLLGTEWGRAVKGDDIWVKACIVGVNKILQINPKANIVIDDCRFENEFEAFPDAFKIHLWASAEARKARADSWRDNETHASETGLDAIPNEKFNMVINTDSWTKDDTAAFVMGALQKEKDL